MTMSPALYLKELKFNRTLFIIWASVISGLIFVTMAAMPSMLRNSQSMNDFIKAYPPEFLKAFSFDASSFQSPLGFFVVYNMMYTMLLGSIFSISITARMLHREQAERTGEFLLVRPLSRGAIIASKLAAWLTLILGMNILLYAAGAASLAAFTPEGFTWSLRDYSVVSGYALSLMLAMGGVGLFVSALARRARSLTGPAVGIVLGFYLLDLVAKMTEDYGTLGWISPFKWVDISVTRQGFGLEPWRVACFLGLAVAASASAALVWRRKDILT
jgi:ABC-2 type transport system permease protein